jgi:hypothetical protein
LFNGKKVLEMIIAQALKVSNDLVKVSLNVSQVPWNHPKAVVKNFSHIDFEILLM